MKSYEPSAKAHLAKWSSVEICTGKKQAKIVMFYIVQSSQLAARIIINDLLTYLLTYV